MKTSFIITATRQARQSHPFQLCVVTGALFLLSPSRALSDAWQPLPLFNGEMTSIVGDPTDPMVFYVGTRDAGIFKTSDGAATWKPARQGLTFYPIRRLAINPSNPQIIYAAADNNGIWKSTSGGQSWLKTSTNMDEFIPYDLVIDPVNTNVIYVALGGGVTSLDYGNIYKTADGGATWAISDRGLPHSSSPGYTSNTDGAVLSLAIDPNNTSIMYAGTHFMGTFMTTNGGDIWIPITTGLPRYLDADVQALALDPHYANQLFAIIETDSDTTSGYYTFTNGHWGIIATDVFLGTSSHLYFHPTNPLIIYAAGWIVLISKDGGTTWEQVDNPIPNELGSVAELAFHPSSPETILLACDYGGRTELGGIYKTIDTGGSFTRASTGLMAEEIRSVAVARDNENQLYVGTGEGAVWKSSDGGQNWSQSMNASDYIFGGEVDGIAIDPLLPQQVYLAGDGGIFRSTNYGVAFQNVEGSPFASCIAMPANASGPIYVGETFGQGVLRSVDMGSSWSSCTNGLPSSGNGICPVLSLAIDPHKSETVWAGMQYGGGIAVSTNAGTNWVVKGLAEENVVYCIAIGPDDSRTMLAGCGFWTGNILKSVDSGATWSAVLTNGPFVYDIVFDPGNHNYVLAATEGGGVLLSKDGGNTWENFSDGIFYPFTYSLAVTPSGRWFVGSYGSGLYELSSLPPTIRLLSPTSLPGGGLTFAVAGSIGQGFVLEASQDLLHWVPISTNYLQDAQFNYTNADPSTFPNRFYRATAAP